MHHGGREIQYLMGNFSPFIARWDSSRLVITGTIPHHYRGRSQLRYYYRVILTMFG